MFLSSTLVQGPAHNDGGFDKAIAQFSAGGHLTEVLTPDERVLYVAATDGVVEEVRITADGSERSSLGRVDVPTNHAVLAAYVPTDSAQTIDGHMVVITFDRERRNSYLWTTTIERSSSRADTLATVRAKTLSGGDVQICWASSLGAPNIEGWSIDDSPATAVTMGDDCVLVLRDRAAGPVASETVTTGPIPSLGIVDIYTSAPPFPTQSGAPVFAPRTDGFVSVFGQHNAAGELEASRFRSLPVTLDQAFDPRHDPRGGGLWHESTVYAETGPASYPFLSFFGAKLHDVTDSFQATQRVSYLGPALGGGVLVGAMDGGFAHFSDGDVRMLAAAVLPTTGLATSDFALVGDDICTVYADAADGPGRVRCADVDPPMDAWVDAVGNPTIRNVLWPAGDRLLVTGSRYGTFWFDPATQSTTKVDDRALVKLMNAEDGSTWGILAAEQLPQWCGDLVRVGDASVEVVPLPKQHLIDMIGAVKEKPTVCEFSVGGSVILAHVSHNTMTPEKYHLLRIAR